MEIIQINGIDFFDYHDYENNIHIRREITPNVNASFIEWSIIKKADEMKKELL